MPTTLPPLAPVGIMTKCQTIVITITIYYCKLLYYNVCPAGAFIPYYTHDQSKTNNPLIGATGGNYWRCSFLQITREKKKLL